MSNQKNLSSLIWQPAPTNLQLSANITHVWYGEFATLKQNLEKYQHFLSIEEKHRAEKFHFSIDRENFTVARACLRELLASYLSCQPADITFAYTEHGKPYSLNHTLQFNLSHTRFAFAIAVNLQNPVGIDIEYNLREVEIHDIAKQVFTPAECEYLAKAPLAEQFNVFYRCWTRKEAYVKALGTGLTDNLTSITTTELDKPITQIDGGDHTWQVIDLPSQYNKSPSIPLFQRGRIKHHIALATLLVSDLPLIKCYQF